MAAARKHQMSHRILLTLLLGAVLCAEYVRGQGDWIDGRATFFADTNDAWQMSRGHCQYGYLSRKHCTGFDVAAVADKNKDYNWGTSNCGMCYEVQCVNGQITDGYGQSFDRNICYGGGGRSVVVQVIDLCECNYAPNSYSNRRWCCGDNQHLDLSVFAFEKLMPKVYGVGKIRYRPVPCNYKPSNEAQTVGSETPLNSGETVKEWADSDARPCPAGTGSSQGGRKRYPTAPKRTKTPKAPKRGSGLNVNVGKWSINSWTGTGINGRTALACGTLLPWGGFTFQGGLQSKNSLDLWVKKEWGNLPNVNVRVHGSGNCQKSRHITGLSQVGWNGDYVLVRVPLRSMGCGGVYKVVVQNNIGNWGWQNICIDGAKAQ